MQNMAYKQEKELRSSRQEFETEREQKLLTYNAGLEGREILKTDSGKIPEGFTQSPYSTTTFVGPKPNKPLEWTPVSYGGKVFGMSNDKGQVINVPSTWKQGQPFKIGNKTIFPQKNEVTGETKYKEFSVSDKNWGPKSMAEAVEYHKQIKGIDAKYALKNELSKESKEKPDKLRKEFIQQSKTFVDVQDAHRRVVSSAEDPSAAGDLALIFNYMKILDPGSVVREGEFATAQNSQGVPERIRAKYNQVMSGERLGEGARRDFVKRAGMMFEKQKQTHVKLRGEYDRIAKNMGIEPSNVIIDYIMPQEKPDPPEMASGQKLPMTADEMIEAWGTK